jgi:hypothetical protein
MVDCCVLMYAPFRLARMIGRPDRLIVRPNLRGSRYYRSAVGSTTLLASICNYTKTYDWRRDHTVMLVTISALGTGPL